MASAGGLSVGAAPPHLVGRLHGLLDAPHLNQGLAESLEEHGTPPVGHQGQTTRKAIGEPCCNFLVPLFPQQRFEVVQLFAPLVASRSSGISRWTF